MYKTRWKKVTGDFGVNKTRTFLVILAICMGIFGISAVANSYSILLREMDRNYMNTNPASATIRTSPLKNVDIDRIKALPYIKEAVQRDRIIGRVQVGNNEWKDIWLFVINDFKDLRLDTFKSEKGKKFAETGEILLERKALTIANAYIGKELKIRIPDKKSQTLKLTGTVHAPGLAPAWMEGFAYGYISRDTFKLLGGETKSSELKILVSEDQMNKEHIRNVTVLLKDYLSSNGIKVNGIEIPRPGKHPHYDQMATLLFLMEIFGLLALILSGVLVANMIASILEQQTRQIGIMKAIGASTEQITALYQGMVVILALSALVLSIPLGIFLGRGYAYIAGSILNFNIYSYNIPIYIFIFEILLGFLIPVAVAAYPIYKGSRVTVREAINDYGISEAKYSGRKSSGASDLTAFGIKQSFISPNKAAVAKLLPRPFLLSLRNTYRRKGRLIFTLLVMAAGGMGFIVAMNIYASMYKTVDEKIGSIAYDIQVTFDQPQKTVLIENLLKTIPGVKKAEAWGGTGASRIYKDGTYGNNFNIIAPKASTEMMSAPPLYEGRWLRTSDKNAIVINQRLLANEPDIKVGDEIPLKIGNTTLKWMVIGISKELMGLPAAYVNSDYLSEVQAMEGSARNAVVSLKAKDILQLKEVSREIEERMESENIGINTLVKIPDFRKALVDHLVVIATFLIIMSILVVIVGGLGLATTISINTMERTREIGIMRSMGASTNVITAIIVTEGIIIGILSWFISVIFSFPLSKFVSYKFGMTFFDAPLEFAASVKGLIIWFLIVIIFAALASFYPSLKAAGMPVKDALSYE